MKRATKNGGARNLKELLALDLDRRLDFLRSLTDDEVTACEHDWDFWARDDQRVPDGDWLYWLILAGRGSGKTRTGAETVRAWARDFALVNLVGPTREDVRDVMVEGESGILNRCLPSERPAYRRASGKLLWPNGSVSLLFSAEEPDRLRGKQHMKLWCDELAAWRSAGAFDQALLGLRLGEKPQAVITTTPRRKASLKGLIADPHTLLTRGVTHDNSRFLAEAFIERITARYAGKAIGRQELHAEIVEDAPGALWSRALIERCRAAPGEVPADFAEVAVAVDPPAKSGAKADECGIVVAGKDGRGVVFVLADLSSQGESPGRWSARVASAYRGFRADRVVAEVNNGGEMVAAVLRQSEAHLPVRMVHATRGKYLRAEPVAAAYERGLVRHAAVFEKLEDQLCALTPDFDRAGASPDRADALVWAVTDLLGLDRPESGGMLDFYKEKREL